MGRPPCAFALKSDPGRVGAEMGARLGHPICVYAHTLSALTISTPVEQWALVGWLLACWLAQGWGARVGRAQQLCPAQARNAMVDTPTACMC